MKIKTLNIASFETENLRERMFFTVHGIIMDKIQSRICHIELYVNLGNAHSIF